MKLSSYYAERNNDDRRKRKLVHPFDGRVIPLDPSLMSQQAIKLSRELSLEGVDYILGFAEGGLISAYAVSSVTGIPFIGSYRLRLKIDGEIHFVEPHSERASHFIYGLQKGASVVVVEDEITSGQTLRNAIIQLESHHIKVNDIGIYILNCSSDDLESFRQIGHSVKYLYTQDVISLPSFDK